MKNIFKRVYELVQKTQMLFELFKASS